MMRRGLMGVSVGLLVGLLCNEGDEIWTQSQKG